MDTDIAGNGRVVDDVASYSFSPFTEGFDQSTANTMAAQTLMRDIAVNATTVLRARRNTIVVLDPVLH